MSETSVRPAIFLLKWPLLALALGVAAASVFVAGGYFYLTLQKREDIQSKRALQDAQNRLSNANKEVADLRASQGSLDKLLATGAFEVEDRLVWTEAIEQMKRRHQLASLEYDLAPQRNVALATGRSFTNIDVRATRIRIKATALHEGDMLGFLNELAQPRRGFYPVESCVLKLLDAVPENPLAARVETNCLMEWVTIKDKRTQVAGAPLK